MIGALVISIGVYFSLIYLLKKERAEVIVTQTQIKEAETRYLRFNELGNFFEENEEAIAVLHSRFADIEASAETVESLERFALTKGVKLETETITEEENATSTFQMLNVSVKAVGSWRTLMRFLEDLSTFKYIHTIEGFDLIASTNAVTQNVSITDSPWQLKFTISFPMNKK